MTDSMSKAESNDSLMVLEILGKNSIICGTNLTTFIVEDLVFNVVPKVRVFVIITDTNIGDLYLPQLIEAFAAVGQIQGTNSAYHKRSLSTPNTDRHTDKTRIVLSYVIPPGEASKSRFIKEQIEDFLLEKGCNRDTCLIALGGGVVGDLVGFLASTFLRGVPFVQIPTTLLAMVDSSIGGKNGVDTPLGKNLIGTIYQPVRIYVDPQFLATLPPREFSNGMAEVIKTSALSSEEEFQYLEAHADELASLVKGEELSNKELIESPSIQKIISRIVLSSIKFKAAIVTEDVRDDGRRQLLNFGHTLGHGLELHFTPHLLHGECVSIGMILETKIAMGLKYNESGLHLERLTCILGKLNLPTSINDPIIQDHIQEVDPISMKKLLRTMKLDKKNSCGLINMVLLSDFGKPVKNSGIPIQELDIVTHIHRDIGGLKSKVEFPNDKSIILIGPRPESQVILTERLSQKLASLLGWEYRNQVKPMELKVVETRHVVTILSKDGNLETNLLLDWIANGGIVINILSSVQEDDKHDQQFETYENASNYSYFFDGVSDNDSSIESAAENLLHLVTYAHGKLFSKNQPRLDIFRSFFLTLLIPDVSIILDDLLSMVSGTSAVELRVDQLEPFKSNPKCPLNEFLRAISRQVSLLRTVLKDHPIIFTLRTKKEGGNISTEQTTREDLYGIYLYAIRLGCDFIDIEINMNTQIIDLIVEAAKMKSRIIASFHCLQNPLDWAGGEAQKYLNIGSQFGDIVKLISLAQSTDDHKRVEDFTTKYYAKCPTIPLIAFNIGKSEESTRMMNRYFTPVTHALLKPYQNVNLSQLTCSEIFSGLTQLGYVESKKFYLFGFPINHSLSPFIHNTNFEYFKLPHTYGLMESMDMDQVKEVIRSTSFGGGSVTMPHKQSIMPLLDSITPIATQIGAVNTIIVDKGKLVGDNTDWLGIFHCVSRRIKALTSRGSMNALLIGAGGTAKAAFYALLQLPFEKIFVANRTPEKMDIMVNAYPQNDRTSEIILLKRLEEAYSTIPGTGCRSLVIIDTTPVISLAKRNAFLNRAIGGGDLPQQIIFVQLAYADSTGADVIECEVLRPGIFLISGIDILIEQALWQSYHYTGLKPDSEFLQKIFNSHVEGQKC